MSGDLDIARMEGDMMAAREAAVGVAGVPMLGLRPVRPGAVMMSVRPPARTATTGTPDAIASRTALGNGSKFDGCTNTSPEW